MKQPTGDQAISYGPSTEDTQTSNGEGADLTLVSPFEEQCIS